MVFVNYFWVIWFGMFCVSYFIFQFIQCLYDDMEGVFLIVVFEVFDIFQYKNCWLMSCDNFYYVKKQCFLGFVGKVMCMVYCIFFRDVGK